MNMDYSTARETIEFQISIFLMRTVFISFRLYANNISDKATIGLYFTFTCVTTCTLILFNKDSTTVCFISGSNTDGRCVLDGGYITCYTYTCNTTTNTYTLTIPRSYLTESLHGTT